MAVAMKLMTKWLPRANSFYLYTICVAPWITVKNIDEWMIWPIGVLFFPINC
jgi:hypothetical protein